MKHKIYNRFVALVASKKFFYGLVAFFVLEASWIAISGRFPMAFDEDFHLGIIKLYAQQWSPFFAHQPAGADAYGAVARDPSYLYHYLMSFPYRVCNGVWHNEFANILMLRFFSIGFLAAAIVVFRKVLGYSKLSPALIHTAFLFFILTPLTPFVAAQANYENLFALGGAICFLLLKRFVTELREWQRVNTPLLLGLVSAGMLTSLVKYAFLPILLVIAVYVAFHLVRAGKMHGLRTCRQRALAGWRAAPVRMKALALGVAVVAAVLFTAMYGYNIVRYHTPTPECDQVLNVGHCKAYGAWNRNYEYAQAHEPFDANPLKFTHVWASTYWYSFFFSINGAFSGFFVASPLPVLYWGATILLGASAILLVRFWRQVLGSPFFRFFGALAVCYIATLWLQNYADFLHLGHHVAEQGRYVLALLLPLYLLIVYCFALALRNRPRLKGVAFTLALLIFLQGGGALTYIIRSDPSWWWEQDAFANALNHAAKKALEPVMIEEPVVNYYRMNGS